MKTSGVFRIECYPTGQMYIDASKNIPNKMAQIKHLLKKGKFSSQTLQMAWDRYGEASFEFSILEECPIDEIENKKSFYIAKYKQITVLFNEDIEYKQYRLSKAQSVKINSTNLIKFILDNITDEEEIRFHNYIIREKEKNGSFFIDPETSELFTKNEEYAYASVYYKDIIYDLYSVFKRNPKTFSPIFRLNTKE